MNYVWAALLVLILFVVFVLHKTIMGVDWIAWHAGRLLPPEVAHKGAIWWIKYVRGPWTEQMDDLNAAMLAVVQHDK